MSDQPPSLLICCFDVVPGPSGLSRRVTEYLKGIGDKFQVVVLSNKTPDHSHIERYHGARLLRVPIGSGDLQSRIQAFDRAVRRQLESEEYQLVHFFDPFGGYALCEARETVGYRLVYDATTFASQELRYTHPHTEGDRRFLSKVRRQELFCLMNSDAVITGSEVTRRFILDQGVPEAQVRVLRAPVELSLYTPEVLGKPDATPMKALYLGSQLGYQGLSTMLRAMQVALRQADLRLTIVGPRHNEWQAHLGDLVNELKLAGKVEFQPPVPHDDLHKIVATCDLGVLVLDDVDRNRSQGGPCAKLGEYLAGGRPVITTDLPITRELLPEAAGVFVPCGDFKKLAEQLVALAQDPGRRIEMGKAARAAAEKVDASWIRGQLLDLYAEVLGRARQPAALGDTKDITRGDLKPVGTRDPNAPKTDPAIRAQAEASEGTDPDAQRAASRAPILGTPLRSAEPKLKDDDSKPLIVGLPLAKTSEEPAARMAVTDRVTVPEQVVMGTPLAETEAAPTPRELPAAEVIIPGKPVRTDKRKTPARGLPPAPVIAVALSSPLPAPAPAATTRSKVGSKPGGAASVAEKPAPPPPSIPDITPVHPPNAPPEPTPIKRPSALHRVIAPTAAARSAPPAAAPAPRPNAITQPIPEPLDAADDEIQEIGDDEVLAADPAADTGDEEVGDQVLEADDADAQAIESDEIPIPSRMDPWFAQLVHGYCPPDAFAFNRHTPPTNFPGRS